jgi:hypothetical protein
MARNHGHVRHGLFHVHFLHNLHAMLKYMASTVNSELYNATLLDEKSENKVDSLQLASVSVRFQCLYRA